MLVILAVVVSFASGLEPGPRLLAFGFGGASAAQEASGTQPYPPNTLSVQLLAAALPRSSRPLSRALGAAPEPRLPGLGGTPHRMGLLTTKGTRLATPRPSISGWVPPPLDGW
jgi:hypothetical protein